MVFGPGMADKPKTVFLTGETHKKLKAESVRRGEKLKETAEKVVSLGLKELKRRKQVTA